MKRMSIDEYFMQIARVVAKRSTCLRHNVGAVLVKDKHILTTGYNGAPPNMEHCLDIGCIRDYESIPSGERAEKCRAIHAEQNAVIQAALHGVTTEGATMYCTHGPCIICAKILAGAKIKRFVFEEDYADREGIDLLKKAGISVEKFNSKY